MIPGARHSKLLCLLCLALPALAASGPGYLAVVGPAPLRFWSPPRPKPAPVSTNAAPASASSQTDFSNPYDFLNAFGSPTPVAPPMNVPKPAPMTEQPTVDTNLDVPPTPPIETAPPGDVVSPQMLLKYFNKSTNGSGTSIIAPFSMPAPQATQTPSAATYSN